MRRTGSRTRCTSWMSACGISTISLAAALLTGCAQTAPDTHDADVAAIKDAEAAWVKDAGTKDIEKFVAHYTDDAALLLPNTPVLSSKDAIRNGLKGMLADPNFAVTFGAVKVDAAKSGDLAYSQGSYSLTTSDAKKAPMTEKGHYLTVWRKQADGSWKSVEDTFMADAPPPAPVAK